MAHCALGGNGDHKLCFVALFGTVLINAVAIHIICIARVHIDIRCGIKKDGVFKEIYIVLFKINYAQKTI